MAKRATQKTTKVRVKKAAASKTVTQRMSQSAKKNAKTTKKTINKRATAKMTKKATKKATKKVIKTGIKTAAEKAVNKAVNKAVASVAIGQLVPNFALPNTQGEEISLQSMRGKKVVLFFYPKDMTPGCTLEGKDFSAMKGDFEAAGAVVFGISRDPIKSHKKFIEKECLTIDLLSDETGLACNLFAVMKEKNLYGKMVLGIERSTFLIDAQGVLRREWRGVKVEGHAAEVLEAVRSLS